MDERCGRVFFQIDDILIDVLHDEFISIFRHPSVHETIHVVSMNISQNMPSHLRGEVQQRVSIERSFVVQQLVRGLGVDAHLRYGIFWNIRGILVSSPGLV
jgi:reverse gyrase